jgi:hypothetical protein
VRDRHGDGSRPQAKASPMRECQRHEKRSDSTQGLRSSKCVLTVDWEVSVVVPGMLLRVNRVSCESQQRDDDWRKG